MPNGKSWRDILFLILQWGLPLVSAAYLGASEIDYQVNPPNESLIPRAINPVAQIPSRSEADQRWLQDEPARESAKARIRESAPERAVPPNASVLGDDCQSDECWQDCDRSRPCPKWCVCSDWRGGRCLPR